MNREIGFGRRLLQILEDEGISYEHTPSGIDNMSVILREEQLAGDVERRVLDRIVKELRVDEVSIERDLALIMVVGEGMERSVGIAAKATAAFARANVNIEMINQGSSEVSMMFGVKADVVEKAVRALYEVYF
ncbi:ACT family regulatory domain [Anoxybacillus flavithermus WK1]|nr:ACT family regulatory domain [Anoxybacillus flavithermus WK1]